MIFAVESIKRWLLKKEISSKANAIVRYLKRQVIYVINRFATSTTERYKINMPSNAKPFLKAYLVLIAVFAIIYMIPMEGFVDSEGVIRMSLVDSFYFSVVTITTLGYGDISPFSWVMKLAVSLEALLGIFMIGLFLVWVGHTLSKKEATEIAKVNRAIMDRPLFPVYVSLVRILNDFLEPFDSQRGRPPNSFGWEFCKFGTDTVSSFTVFNDETKWAEGNPNVGSDKLLTELQKTVAEAVPVVDDLGLLEELDKLYDLIVLRNRVTLGVGQEFEKVRSIVESSIAIREQILKKADRRTDGVSHRYTGHHRF